MEHSPKTKNNYPTSALHSNPIGSPYADHIRQAIEQGASTINLAALRQLRVVEGGAG